MGVTVRGTAHVAGEAAGAALMLDEPVSLWGGVDPETGEIVDQNHPQVGESIAGTVLVLPHGRGSSGGSGVLAELLRAGVGPAAIVMRELDAILLVGAVVAQELYGVVCPVIVVGDGYEDLRTRATTRIEPDGRVTQN